MNGFNSTVDCNLPKREPLTFVIYLTSSYFMRKLKCRTKLNTYFHTSDFAGYSDKPEGYASGEDIENR